MKNYLLIPVLAFAFMLPLSVAHAAPEGSFDEASYSVLSTKKASFSGEAEDVTTVRVAIENEKGKVVLKGKEVRVKNGEWKVRVEKKLPVGEYTVLLTGREKKGKRQELASTTLLVTKKGSSSATLSVSMLPLLMGGTATSGSSVPVAYVKVYNSGTASTSIRGFTLTENGSAPDSVVTGFSTSDDKGGSRTTSSATFKKGSAYVPLEATLAPGQIRIFTIKATLAPSLSGAFGSQLKINVSSVDTSAKVSATYPLLGTTWTLGF